MPNWKVHKCVDLQAEIFFSLHLKKYMCGYFEHLPKQTYRVSQQVLDRKFLVKFSKPREIRISNFFLWKIRQSEEISALLR